MNNLYYRRSESDWIGHDSTSPWQENTDRWRKVVRRLFASWPPDWLETVEVVRSGLKTDSKVLKRGQQSARGFAVIVASVPGKDGYPPKPQQIFYPFGNA